MVDSERRKSTDGDSPCQRPITPRSSLLLRGQRSPFHLTLQHLLSRPPVGGLSPLCRHMQGNEHHYTSAANVPCQTDDAHAGRAGIGKDEFALVQPGAEILSYLRPASDRPSVRDRDGRHGHQTRTSGRRLLSAGSIAQEGGSVKSFDQALDRFTVTPGTLPRPELCATPIRATFL